MKPGFFDKLIDRLDRLDPKSVQSHFLRLVQEKGLLETIFQSLQEGVVVIDGTGGISFMNKAAENFLGISFDDVRGRHIRRFLAEIDWDSLMDFEEREWTKLISHEIEVSYPEKRFLNFYVMPLAMDKAVSDKNQGAVIMMRDVTRDRMQEASVLESERIKAIQLLAAGVAHEIGNPLNALNIHLQLLGRDLDKITSSHAEASQEISEEAVDSLKDLLAVAKNEVVRLDTIITQFLRALRPVKPVLSAGSIEKIIEETLILMRHEIENRNIHVEVHKPLPLPKIMIDHDQIKQAFFNVIRNAFQALPNGGRMEITLELQDHYLDVSFKDNGSGITSQGFQKIFEPYYTTKKEGSGLGLMIVQRIVQDHGGMIKLSSKPGEGTIVSIMLPLAERRVRMLSKGSDTSGKNEKER